MAGKAVNRMGPRIRELREQRGMTNDELAAQSLIKPDILARIERGQASISIDLATRIAGALGVTVSALTTPGPTDQTVND